MIGKEVGVDIHYVILLLHNYFAPFPSLKFSCGCTATKIHNC